MHAHGSHIGQNAERLPKLAVKPGLANLILEHGVGVTEQIEPLFCRFAANDSNRQPRPWEWLAPDEPLRHPQLGPDRADLILEKRTQRFNQLKLHVVGQATDVVVRLDRRCTSTSTRFDHVGVERALDEKLRSLELRRLFLKDANELGADDLALRLRVANTGQLAEETVLSVDGDERHGKAVTEGLDHLRTLVLAHHPVVDEDAGQLIADCSVNQQCGDR